MQEESNPVKDYLFDYISKNSERIHNLISKQRFSDIIDDVVANCYDNAVRLGGKDESIGVLATGLLHFLLTSALITSQRKVSYQGIDIDIVIPDIKTLEKDPKKTLLICIPKTTNKDKIKQKLNELQKVQPENQNILVVLSKEENFESKSYTIQKKDNTFSKIIFDIAQFVNVQGQNKFKILKV